MNYLHSFYESLLIFADDLPTFGGIKRKRRSELGRVTVSDGILKIYACKRPATVPQE
jgi:hypothetical protein